MALKQSLVKRGHNEEILGHNNDSLHFRSAKKIAVDLITPCISNIYMDSKGRIHPSFLNNWKGTTLVVLRFLITVLTNFSP